MSDLKDAIDDMNQLLNEQQEFLDKVDTDVETADVAATDANEELGLVSHNPPLPAH